MQNDQSPDFSLFLDIIHTFEEIDIPYMVIGAFAAIIYGSTRTTYDIDIVVDLSDEQVDMIVERYPSPRYYCDPFQIRDSIKHGIMFNIIDSSRGEKADLIPLSMVPRYAEAFAHRVRETAGLSEQESFKIWCASPQDIIIGKLMAWAEGKSRKHETDIYQMLVFNYTQQNPERRFPEERISRAARQLGRETEQLWHSIKEAANSTSR